jgi:DNA polymerase I-like protein with 3'-5' exonuclease and polymerase domains
MKEYGFDRKASKTFDIDPAAVRKFGVLTESVQVGTAIALAKIERIGMHTDRKRLARTARSHSKNLEKLVDTIKRKYPRLFRLDAEGQVKRTAKTGVPSKSNKALDEYLLKAVADIQTKTNDTINVPRTAKGKIAKSLKIWEPLVGKHPFLKTWAEHEKATKLCQFLINLNQPIIRPHYRAFCRTGRTTCSRPNMQQIPRQDAFREVVVPAPGHLMLAVDYKYIELVTLAAACQCRFGFSKLAEVIRAGTDPHCYTAAMLLGMTYEEFMWLKSKDLDKFKQWR